MKKIILLSLVIFLFAYGCLDTYKPISPPVTPPANQSTNDSTMDCNKYCLSQPHVQCAGTWNNSGTYPNCTCSYICTSVPVTNQSNQTQNQSANSNYCLSVSDCTNDCTGGSLSCQNNNCTCVMPTTPPVVYPVTNKSVSEILSESLKEINSQVFSAAPSGQAYTAEEYTWTYYSANGGNAPADVPVGAGILANDIYLNNQNLLPGIYGLAFKIFTPTSGPNNDTVVKGLAVFLTEPGLAKYNTITKFNLRFKVVRPEVALSSCAVEKTTIQKDTLGRLLYIYDFSCGYVAKI